VAVTIATQKQEKIFVRFLLRDKGDLWPNICNVNQVFSYPTDTNFTIIRKAIAAARTDQELTHTEE
jgi:hypothetical protein